MVHLQIPEVREGFLGCVHNFLVTLHRAQLHMFLYPRSSPSNLVLFATLDEARTSILVHPAAYTVVSSSSSAFPCAMPRYPSGSIALKCVVADSKVRSHIGKDSGSLTTAMLNSVTCASMHANGG